MFCFSIESKFQIKTSGICFLSLQGLKAKCLHPAGQLFLHWVSEHCWCLFIYVFVPVQKFHQFFSVSVSWFHLHSILLFVSVSTMWIVQMTGKIKYCWYCIILKNCPIRTSCIDHGGFKVFVT
jgi:hypothetical protein